METSAAKSQGDGSTSTAALVAQAFATVIGPLKEGAAVALVRFLDEGKVEELSKDIANAKRLALARGSKTKSVRRAVAVRQRLEVRLAVGSAYNAHKETAQAAGDKCFVRSFCEKHFELHWNCSVRERVRKYGALAAKAGSRDGALGNMENAARYGRSGYRWLPFEIRKNVASTQGRPLKAVPLRHMLYQWFVDFRTTVKGRIPQKLVLGKARILAKEYVEVCIAAGDVPACPKITRAWLAGWKRQYRVSFRKPNRRYKLSRRGCKLRLEIFWMNNIRVRHFAKKMLGIDPGAHCDGADQKGWHVAQAGSKEKGTLDFKGAEDVPILENHAATRERLSFMTYCSNNEDRIERGLPLVTCFKLQGTGERVLDQIVLPEGPFSVRVSDSGSYREEHVFCYLEQYLEPATPERREKQDWRLFYLDIYAGHLSFRIWEICWMRMYVLLYHGGGVTGLTQVNDLWLHWMMEVILGEMETIDVDAHMALRPGKIYTPTRQSIINNACAMWKPEVEHRRSIQWTLRTGASMSLESDAETTRRTLSRQLHIFWEELDMATKRREAIQAIDDDMCRTSSSPSPVGITSWRAKRSSPVQSGRRAAAAPQPSAQPRARHWARIWSRPPAQLLPRPPATPAPPAARTRMRQSARCPLQRHMRDRHLLHRLPSQTWRPWSDFWVRRGITTPW